jgi:uncharacterized membrane protein (DUF106 family)
VLDFLFAFLLNYTPAFAVIIFAIITLFVINIFYKLLINQNEAKQVKQRSKDLNKELREAQKAKNTEKANKLMSEMLAQNSKMMKFTMKPMMVSLIVVVLFLPSMSTFYGDKLVSPGNTTMINNVNYTVVQDGSTVKIGELTCTAPCTEKIGKYNYKVSEENGKVKVALIVAMLPISLPILGNTFGWLGWYIICSIPLVVVIRKFMKIYV